MNSLFQQQVVRGRLSLSIHCRVFLSAPFPGLFVQVVVIPERSAVQEVVLDESNFSSPWIHGIETWTKSPEE